jgi:hypothetical protein
MLTMDDLGWPRFDETPCAALEICEERSRYRIANERELSNRCGSRRERISQEREQLARGVAIAADERHAFYPAQLIKSRTRRPSPKRRRASHRPASSKFLVAHCSKPMRPSHAATTRARWR